MAKPKKRPKTGGRKKGTPNRTTAQMKEWVANFVNENFDGLQKDLEALKPQDRLEVIIKLLPYVIPKQKETQLSMNEETMIAMKESIENINELF